jgi:putative component of membrane protein insertase Oxa1/YidC/SpoIIIJ protein YidD
MQQLAKAFGVRFESFEVHGDTSEEAIKTFMGEKVKEPKQPTLVFFDEINATPAIGLFKELVCNRTLRGKPIAETILIAAACNPYRKKNLRSIQVRKALVATVIRVLILYRESCIYPTCAAYHVATSKRHFLTSSTKSTRCLRV